MTIKSIFVPLTDAQNAGATLGAAFRLAKDFDAHVDVLHIRADPTEAIADFVGESVSASLVDEVMSAAEARATTLAAKTRKAFEDTVRSVGISLEGKGGKAKGASCAYQEAVGESTLRIEQGGRCADLTIMRRPAKSTDVGARAMAESALLGSGRPVLLVPPRPAPSFGKSVAIAWNGSEQAARAVVAALPFMAKAATVTVIAAAENGDEQESLDSMVRYLSRHGIVAQARRIKAGSDTGKAVLSAATRAKADLLVMGAFTHSRVRQIVFGGVTSHVMLSSRIPVLLAH